jgi:hypothetical protein
MRKHTIWEDGAQQDIPFTAAEEAARDAEEGQNLIDSNIWNLKETQRAELIGKLTSDTITLGELRELMRVERGL